MSIVVFGSANADLTVSAERCPEPGETLTGTSFAVGLGGKGLNQAVAAARLGATTAFVGRVGGDAYGAQLAAALVGEGIDVDDLVVDDESASGAALIIVEPEGQNRIVVVPGANGRVSASDVTRLEARLPGASLLLVQLELPLAAVVAAVQAAGRHGVRVLVDPAPVPGHELPVVFYAPHVVLTPNESETAALVGFEPDDDAAVERAARVLLARGAGGVLLKLGERGLYWASPHGSARAPATRVRVVDTVGAGDAVNGAFAASLAQGYDHTVALARAAAAGGLAVTRAGALSAMPTEDELERALGQVPSGASGRSTLAGSQATG